MSEPRQQPPEETARRDPRSADFCRYFSAHLLAAGAAEELGLRRAMRAQTQSAERFDLVLSRLGIIGEAELARQLASFLKLPCADAGRIASAGAYPGVLQAPFLKSRRLLPLEADGERVLLAMADPFDDDAAAAISFLFEAPVERLVAAPADIDRAIATLYAATPAAAAAATAATDDASDDDVRRLADLASEAPVIRLVQDLIARAAETGASDIHIEPTENALVVRYRIDGVLHTVETLPPAMRAAITSRVKIMARLDIAERRLPQDGRIKVSVRGREIDLRVSTMPTIAGESVVLRLLDRAHVALDFAALGFAGPALDGLTGLLARPNGIVLVTGPTGSGKTTTLYAALACLNTPERKIFTVEDPIEYHIPGISQIQVQPKIGLTFAHALRSILRQDPDVIMIGEIRDLETAQIAIQASLTGHLVLSTVHTNSAAATITRLIDMGVEDYLLASSLTGVLAQRLVRRLCEACAAPVSLPDALFARLGGHGTPARARAKTGCHACRGTGFSGRTTISELMTIDDAVRNLIVARAGEKALEDAATSSGMRPMLADGMAKVADGTTTIEEVLRVTRGAP